MHKLQKIKANEVLKTLLTAREIAMDFRNKKSRINALDEFLTLLRPMVEWLDIPTENWLQTNRDKSKPISEKRVLPIFKRYGDVLPVGLTRNSHWVTCSPDRTEVVRISSEAIVDTVAHHRFQILGYHSAKELVNIETPGVRSVIKHSAFLAYLTSGLDDIDKILEDREKRMNMLRENASIARLFTKGIDPFTHQKVERFPGYVMFYSTERGMSRCQDRTFLTREIVENRVSERNNVEKNESHFVYDESRSIDKILDFISRLEVIASDIRDDKTHGREPFSEKEKGVLEAYIANLGK